MAIQTADRTVIRAWTGPISDEAEAETLLADLGSPYAVALQILMDRRAGFEQDPARRSSGGDSIDHSANLKRLDERIETLVAAINGSADIDLSDDAQALVDSATGTVPDQTRIIGSRASNPRRGG